MKYNFPQSKLVAVWYRDHTEGGKWVETDDHLPTIPIVCCVGWLLKETDDAVYLCSDICTTNGGDAHGVSLVLRECIVQRRAIPLPKKRRVER